MLADRAPFQHTILVVDDNPGNLGVISDWLEAHGYEVMAARNGEDALHKAHLNLPDLVLLDILLPGIDGFETCRRMKSDSITEGVPVIFMTALAETENKIRGFEAGGVDYVVKPIRYQELIARISTHLRIHDQIESKTGSETVEKSRLFDAIHRQRLELSSLARKISNVQEDERRRLSLELHDDVGQSLTAVLMLLTKALRTDRATMSAEAVEDVEEARSQTEGALDRIRLLSHELHPPVLDYFGLPSVLRWYGRRFMERTDIAVSYDIEDSEMRLPPTTETALFRIVQESLNNTARHSGAGSVEIAYRMDERRVTVAITDDGCGFDAPTQIERVEGEIGIGLIGMQERVNGLGGRLEIVTSPGAGTSVRATVPFGNDR